jgi:hypothetical protein
LNTKRVHFPVCRDFRWTGCRLTQGLIEHWHHNIWNWNSWNSMQASGQEVIWHNWWNITYGERVILCGSYNITYGDVVWYISRNIKYEKLAIWYKNSWNSTMGSTPLAYL